jgi:hypothetical protein
MPRDEDHPHIKRHLRLLPAVNGQPKHRAKKNGAQKEGPVFVPGRTYSNWRMNSVDFLVERVGQKAGRNELTGVWVKRTNKNEVIGKSTDIRINIPEDWKLLPLNTHPRRDVNTPIDLVREHLEPDPLDGPPLDDDPQDIA